MNYLLISSSAIAIYPRSTTPIWRENIEIVRTSERRSVGYGSLGNNPPRGSSKIDWCCTRCLWGIPKILSYSSILISESDSIRDAIGRCTSSKNWPKRITQISTIFSFDVSSIVPISISGSATSTTLKQRRSNSLAEGMKSVRLSIIIHPFRSSSHIKAYEFALHNMSLDINCTPLWVEYLSFLKEFVVRFQLEISTWFFFKLKMQPTNKYEEGQRMNSLRRVYQRAIETPMHNLEAIWNEYNQFENDLNKIQVKFPKIPRNFGKNYEKIPRNSEKFPRKFREISVRFQAKVLLAEHSGRYMNARAIYREKKRYYEGILRNLLARPPGAAKSVDREDHQVNI